MPALTALVLRFLPHILIALGIIGAMLWIDHRGYQRAVADQQRAEARARVHIAEELSKIDGNLAGKIDKIRIIRSTINNTIQKEIIREARYTDPACDLTPGMFASINSARAASGSITVALPGPVPTD